MNEIQQRIAEILADKYIGVDRDYDLYTISERSCRELAEVLVAELGLREDRNIMTQTNNIPAPADAPQWWVTRYVTDWEPRKAPAGIAKR